MLQKTITHQVIDLLQKVMDSGSLVENASKTIHTAETKSNDTDNEGSGENVKKKNLAVNAKTVKDADTPEDSDDLMQLLVQRMARQLANYRSFDIERR